MGEDGWAVYLDVCSGRTISSVGLAAKLAIVTNATPSTSRAPPPANNLNLRESGGQDEAMKIRV